MRLLVDRDIIAAMQGPYPIARNLPQPLDVAPTTTSQIQAASLNLTVGDIFIPSTELTDLGSVDHPLAEYELPQGHTAVVKTRESIHLNTFRAGIAFPPAHVSLKGLLITNPGHVDPGYSGHLHCTVINMAHRTFCLRRGDPIMRVLIFEFPADSSPDYPYYMRKGLAFDSIGQSPINRELLERLSVDFVDVEKRSVEAAKREVDKAQIRAMFVPIGTTLIAAAISAVAAYFAATLPIKDEVAKLRERFATAEKGLENKNTLDKLQNEIGLIREELKILEGAERQSKQPANSR